MNRRLMTITAAAALVLLPVTPAAAAPGEPNDGHIYSYDVGPDKTDWFCTYQLSVEAVTCVYAPGEGSSSGKLAASLRSSASGTRGRGDSTWLR